MTPAESIPEPAPPTVLIVDDNPQNLQVLGNIMEKNGYEAALALDGPQALEYLMGESPDLILLDVMMPEMDGYQVCERIKASNKTRDIPVIFLTAKTSIDDVVKGFEAGAVDYVTKPFTPAELLARVKTHIELKRARDEIRTLRGIIPICANCKSVRSDDGFWQQVEVYVQRHSDASFSHSLCPGCVEKLYPGMFEKEKPDEKED